MPKIGGTPPSSNGNGKPKPAAGLVTPKPVFKSGSQVLVSRGRDPNKGRVEPKNSGGTGDREKTYDIMLRDPTIRLATDVVIAMLKRQPWTVEGEDPKRCNYIYDQFESFREMILRSTFRGYLRTGWRCFEVAYAIDPEYTVNTIAGLKPLKPQNTHPLLYIDTGEFAGCEVEDLKGGQPISIDEKHILFINFDEDGFGELGDPLLRVSEGPFNKWEACDVGAQRYDKKVAGGFLFIEYPVGATPYSARGGAETDNAEIMEDLANGFEAAGYGGVPVLVDPDTGERLQAAWTVEHIAAGGGLQPDFISRLKYLDALKLRAFGIPERATSEGTFGTKAEAEAHADIAIIVNLDRHDRIISAINEGPLKCINEANWGNSDETRLVLGKLEPQDRELFAAIFTSLMTDPVFGERIAGQIDSELLLDKLNVPVLDLPQAPIPGMPPLPGAPGSPPVPGAQQAIPGKTGISIGRKAVPPTINR